MDLSGISTWLAALVQLVEPFDRMDLSLHDYTVSSLWQPLQQRAMQLSRWTVIPIALFAILALIVTMRCQRQQTHAQPANDGVMFCNPALASINRLELDAPRNHVSTGEQSSTPLELKEDPISQPQEPECQQFPVRASTSLAPSSPTRAHLSYVVIRALEEQGCTGPKVKRARAVLAFADEQLQSPLHPHRLQLLSVHASRQHESLVFVCEVCKRSSDDLAVWQCIEHESAGCTFIAHSYCVTPALLGDYYGERNHRRQPHGLGARIGSDGVVADGHCGRWHLGMLEEKCHVPVRLMGNAPLSPHCARVGGVLLFSSGCVYAGPVSPEDETEPYTTEAAPTGSLYDGRTGALIAEGMWRGGHKPIKRYVGFYIGVSDYLDAPRLEGCANDVQSIAESLELHGFQAADAQQLSRPTHAEITQALEQLYSRLLPHDVLLLYYSGHGSAVLGDTLLLTVDGVHVSLAGICARIYAAQPHAVTIAVLDCCRVQAEVEVHARAYPQGNVLTVFATSPGTTAAELRFDRQRLGWAGLFTECFLGQLWASRQSRNGSWGVLQGHPVGGIGFLHLFTQANKNMLIRSRQWHASLQQVHIEWTPTFDITKL